MRYLYWITDNLNPYHNLALEQALMEALPEDSAILYLWQNSDTIVVGRNQDVYTECRVDEFLHSGGRIARRVSGGGAVYHDIGNLNYSIIFHFGKEDECRYYKLLKKALALVGIEATYNDRNDLTADGRKISGNAVYKTREAVCQHGTVLVSTDIDRMAHFLTPNKSKLRRNKVQSVVSRVGNIKNINAAIGITDIKNALIESANAELLNYEPDKDYIDELTSFYKSDEWIFGGKR